MLMFANLGSALSISQVNGSYANLSTTVYESNIYSIPNFSKIVKIEPNFIGSLNNSYQLINIQYDNSTVFSEIGFINAKSDQSNASSQFNITVPKAVSFSLSTDSFNKNTDYGKSGIFWLYIDNTGNSETNLSVNSTGNLTDYIIYQKSILLPKSKLYYEINYTMPNQVGLFSSALTFLSDGFNKSANITFNVTDTAEPKILNYTYKKEIETGEKTSIEIKATDDIGISNVTVKIGYVNLMANLTDNIYKTEYKGEVSGFYTLEISIFDTSGNKESAVDSIKVRPVNATNLFKIKNTLNLGTKAYNISSRDVFFYSDKPINITLEKVEFSVMNKNPMGVNLTEEPKILLLYGDKNINFENFTILNLDRFNGGLAIEIKPNNWTFDYSGRIRLTLPSQYEYDNEIRFDGSSKNYTVCVQKTFNLFKYPLEFKPIDTGNYENSYCEGVMKYPIDFNVEDSLIVVSPSEREQIFKQQYEQTQFWRGEAGNLGLQRNIIIIILFLVGIALAFLYKVYPHMSG